MNNKKLLGKRIQEFRKSIGLTQEKLAEAINIETGSLSAIESGRHFPSLPTLEKIATQLNIELKALFDFNQQISTEKMIKKITDNLNKLNKEEIKFIHAFVDFYK